LQPISKPRFAASFVPPRPSSLYVLPEITYGFRLSPKVELQAGLTSWLLVRLGNAARWDNGPTQNAPFVPGTGFVRYGDESLLGNVAFFVGPSVGSKFDL
jgi:hypothetical protein